MSFLLDTRIVSETRKRNLDRNVLAWLQASDQRDLCIGVLTIGELTKGARRRRRRDPKAAAKNPQEPRVDSRGVAAYVGGMSEYPESSVLEHLRAIRAKLDEHDQKFREAMQRIGSVERHMAVMQGDIVEIRHALDRMDERIGRIWRRLDLEGEPAG